jgi:L-fuconolactonase
MSDQSTGQAHLAPLFSVDETWLARRCEDIIEPDLPIVDPHHHLWDRETRYLFDELRADTGSGHDIRATVFMQCGSMYRADGDPDLAPIGETEFVNGIAAMSASGHYGAARLCAGIVGFADLTLGARVAPVLEAQIGAGGGRFRGIRHSTVWHADPSIRTTPMLRPPGLMGERSFRDGFACLAPLGLSFDAWLYHTQLPEIVALACDFPETTIVLDHLGGILGIGPYAGKRDEVFGQWRRDIAELARCPNASVKLGGLAMRTLGFGFDARAMPPSSEELADAWRPYIETCITAFGAERCMFESNFPVDKGSCSYPILWNAFKRLAGSASATEKTALFSGTARRIYRLADVATPTGAGR